MYYSKETALESRVSITITHLKSNIRSLGPDQNVTSCLHENAMEDGAYLISRADQA